MCLQLCFSCSWLHELTAKEPNSYYASLTDAFLHGQTYFRQEPDPRLALLKNPYAGAQDIPRIHDATYFNHHYYLYFGAVPVILLMLPFQLLTGEFLSEPALVQVFCFGGFAAGLLCWVRIQRTFFPNLSNAYILLGAAILGIGSYVPPLLILPVFYQVASACGYFCIMVALFCSARATSSPYVSTGVAWLVAASGFFGLSVGSRPTYAACIPAFGVFALILGVFGPSSENSRSRRILSYLFAAVIPAGTIGAGLALYNWCRFGDPLEFGIKYQFAAGDMRTVKLAGLENIVPNLRTYVGGGADYRRYFPFVWPRSTSISLWPWAPLAFASLLLPFTLVRKAGHNLRWIALGALVFLSAFFAFAGLLLFPYPLSRYAIDFIPATLMAGMMGLMFFIYQSRGVVRRAWVLALAISTCLTCAHGLLFIFSNAEQLPFVHKLARVMDYPTWWIEKRAGTQFGTVSGTLRIAPLPDGTREPMVTTGGDRDVLFLEHVSPTTARFGFFHLGTVSPLGEAFAFDPNKEVRFEFDLGGLYPPPEHPIFSGAPGPLIDLLKRRVHVSLDNTVVYETASAFYFSTPGLERIGANPDGVGTLTRAVSKISVTGRGGIPNSILPDAIAGKDVRLTIRFPHFSASFGEPLLSLGARGEGDLVYATYIREGELRLGIDSARGGAVESRNIKFEQQREHTVDVRLPIPSTDHSGHETTMRIYFDGDPVLFLARPVAHVTPYDTVIGFNGVGSSAARTSFSGPHLRWSSSDPSPQTPQRVQRWGSIKLLVLLPEGRTGAHEPILTTGKTGAGDFVYFIYTDANHLQVAFDHWGVGGMISDPVEIDYTKVNAFEISIGSLYPQEHDKSSAAGGSDNRQKVRIEVNGRPVLDRPFPSYPSPMELISIGRNDIGGSSCEQAFTGKWDLIPPGKDILTDR
ncbi:MAG TPA: hypothetical protein VFT72_00210 [Opitutaceae bacterium]|nr:hypothetical protein [Opitutaceae bacterium]